MNNFKLNSTTNLISNTQSPKLKILVTVIVALLSLIFAAPIFIIIYRFFPNIILDLGIIIRVDMILSFLLAYIPIFTILRFFSTKIIIGFVTFFLIAISVLQIIDIYSFSQIKIAYFELLSRIENTPVKLPFLGEDQMTIRNADEILKAIDYETPALRDFAVEASITYFSENQLYNKYGNIVRYFSVFKTINEWKYVPDPKRFDYFSKASETIKFLAGDCDDHAIVMAASIMAIGGEARLIHTQNHLYPEVNVGKSSDLSTIYNLIKRQFFYKESMGQQIYYRVDDQKNVWMNFDYTGHYPGSKYYDEKIIGILKLK